MNEKHIQNVIFFKRKIKNKKYKHCSIVQSFITKFQFKCMNNKIMICKWLSFLFYKMEMASNPERRIRNIQGRCLKQRHGRALIIFSIFIVCNV